MNVERPPCMTEEQADGFGTKRFWWARGPDGFVKFGRFIPASGPLSVDLPPGVYLLGAGPPDHYREDIQVHADGSTSEPDDNGRAPCATRYCTGVLECSVGPWPDALLCSACRAVGS